MIERTQTRNPAGVAGERQEARAAQLHAHLLGQILYGDVPHQTVTLPKGSTSPDYARRPIPASCTCRQRTERPLRARSLR